MSPFEALYGRTPPAIPNYAPGEAKNRAVDRELRTRDQLLSQLKRNLAQAQNRMMIQANRKRVNKQYNVHDWVLVKLRPYRQQSLANRLSNKLAWRYYGPYRVLAKVGSVAYALELPLDSKVHPVFHVSLLKPFYGDPTQVTPSLFPDVQDNTQQNLEDKVSFSKEKGVDTSMAEPSPSRSRRRPRWLEDYVA